MAQTVYLYVHTECECEGDFIPAINADERPHIQNFKVYLRHGHDKTQKTDVTNYISDDEHGRLCHEFLSICVKEGTKK